MTLFLANKHILLGVTGSIAAYKSAELVRRLREAGAIVRVAMTENAKRFITPLTMQAVSGYPVHDDLFDVHAEAAMGHIELARWADLILVAPATADFMTRLAHGHADDLLTTLCLATKAPLAVAPAMNQGMWKHALTQTNRQVLLDKGVHIIGPGEGNQACGDVGPGRMTEPAEIVEKVNAIFSSGLLAGLKIIVTAGPTHEAIDPVRFMTNGSSGKMGYALAEAASEAGADVTLVSGPVNIPKPSHLEKLDVVTAQEMYETVMRKVAEYDIFLAVAAVSDYRCETIAPQKIHKEEGPVQLTLTRNPDIVASVGQLARKPFIVGFAAETEDVIAQAKAKRLRKKMDMIIANQVGSGAGMGADENAVTLISAENEISLPLMPKRKLARQLIKLIAEAFNKAERRQ
ncbi:bifunctional phosphopantothenoylcysteine decarboxylase/phosphopantothenate--cysteine ligase CoaBC [Aquicella lusitana]|uniref:Coenzyme A biosynthesis bifunctional protein CoaBC n=1 Tax=Aquicella lusitana TaxID=254246 RepID=A0A370GLD1_9COXI|nr:bifunctional phosphopantothenoylcysteine decarboxylase/phosphopantothenate--cysteine ligase CoaBC [Aquicella lusitana]RDI44588.1 phosphopantothenoylcysteine decarboxylase/phosphopantothenate--cysteine ligase [Aquicella lusitana]VVC72470.1 Coenzyme A biosynthesis bifunctional protein CoaBC [Aquicella lusitana]